MEKIKERIEQYAVSVRVTSNGYYEARVSVKLGGSSRSERLQKGGKSEELAVLNLLTALDSYIDTCYKSGIITTKIDDSIPQRLVKSINDLGIITPEITARTLAIVNKINTINANILNTIPTNIIPFYNPQSVIPNAVAPAPALVPNNITNNLIVETPKEKQEICIIEDFALDFMNYRLSLCEKSEDNPKPKSINTVKQNIRLLKTKILPFFKSNKILYLNQISEKVIISLLKSLNGYHNKNDTYIVLSLLFQYAKKKNKLTANPLENVDKPIKPTKDEETEIKCIDPENQDTYLDMFKKENTDMSILFFTMLLTGVRPECACGLKWTALDLENNELIINNAVKDFPIYDENMKVIGHERHDDRLKTPESYRRIPLNPRLKEILLKHKERQKEIFRTSRAIKKKGRKWSENEYMFLSRTYGPYVADTLSSGLPELCDKYELPRYAPYDLRHSFATFCSENGMEEIVLMHLMGHNDFNTTKKYYIKVSSKRKKLAMQEAYKVVFYERKAS